MTQILLPLGDEACNARPEPYLRLEEPVVVFTGGLGLLRMVQHLLRVRGRVRARVLGLGLGSGSGLGLANPNPNHRHLDAQPRQGNLQHARGARPSERAVVVTDLAAVARRAEQQQLLELRAEEQRMQAAR